LSDAVHSSDDATAQVVAAFIYPIKACGGVAVDRLHIDRFGGAQGDRQWAVINAANEVTWQGDFPRLVRVVPQLHGDRLVLGAPGLPPMPVMFDALGSTSAREIRLWNEPMARHDVYEAHDAGDAAAAWLGEAAGAALRLVRLPDDAVGREHANRLHVVVAESCEEIDQRLAARGLPAAAMARYRPNLVLRGLEEPLLPFVEDHLKAIAWRNDAAAGRIDVNARCVRCVVPEVDPATGAPGKVMLPLLAELSTERLPGQPVSFGVYGRGTPGGVLAVGQHVAVELDW
jgi:uncharacterized protein YcbX